MGKNNRYDSLFQYYADVYTLDWVKLKAQGMAESNLNPVAISHVGAMGIMQFMPATFDEWKAKLGLEHPDPFNPEHSIMCGAAYMDWLLSRYNRDCVTAWAAYNWGIGNLNKGKRLHEDNWLQHAPVETRNYVKRIQKHIDDLLAFPTLV